MIEERSKNIKTAERNGHHTADCNSNKWAFLPIGAVDVDPDGTVTFANPSAKRMIGSFLDDFGRFTCTHAFKLIQDDGLDFEPRANPVLRAFQTGKAVENVVAGILNQEKKLYTWLRVDAIPQFKRREAKPFSVTMFLTDISESKTVHDLINLHLQLELSLSSTHGLAKSMDLILQHACSIRDFDCGGIYIVDRITGALDLMAHRGLPPAFTECRSRLDFTAPQTRLVIKGEPVYSIYPEDYIRSFVKGTISEPVFTYLALIPFGYDGRVTGALFLFSRTLKGTPSSVRHALEAIAARLAAVIARENAVEALKDSENSHRDLLNTMNEGFIITDDAFTLTYANDRLCEMLGYELDEIIGLPVKSFLDEENRKILNAQLEKRKKGEMEPYELEWKREDRKQVVTLVSPRPILDSEGKFKESFSVLTDITELKRTEEALRKREKELTVEKGNLEEVNTALRVLLQKREDDISEVEQRIFLNMKKMVAPYIEKIKGTRLNGTQSTFMKIIESNLEDIISAFSQNLSAKYSELTYTEIQIANLIRQGMITKEIASILNVSERTVDVHRFNIRKKMGLTGKRIGLRSYLSQFK